LPGGRRFLNNEDSLISPAWRAPGLDNSLMGHELVHAGFPDGLGRHLADGWKENYREPLEKYLS
jgi:hypothetical protein